MSTFALILPAAGKSTRFGGVRSKVLETLVGQSVISRAIAPFLQHPKLAAVIIPCSDADSIREALGEKIDSRIVFCNGGASRAHSVLEGLKRVPAHVDWVAVHDAARPLVSLPLIDSTLRTAQEHGAAVPALAVHLTIKEAQGPLPAPVERTIPRQSLWAMQTPQITRRDWLLRAFDSCPLPLEQVTDDMQLIELMGEKVWLVPGDERNLKITTVMDLQLAGMWLSAS